MQVGRPTVELAEDVLEFPSVIHALDYAAEHVPERIVLVCGEHAIDYAGYRRAVGGMAAMIGGLCNPGNRAAVDNHGGYIPGGLAIFEQAFGLALVIIFPELILWLRRLVYG